MPDKLHDLCSELLIEVRRYKLHLASSIGDYTNAKERLNTLIAKAAWALAEPQPVTSKLFARLETNSHELVRVVYANLKTKRDDLARSLRDRIDEHLRSEHWPEVLARVAEMQAKLTDHDVILEELKTTMSRLKNQPDPLA